jgi:hypothetical protein
MRKLIGLLARTAPPALSLTGIALAGELVTIHIGG